MDLNGKRILVTGAAGFIGGRVADRLAKEEGAQVRAFVRRPLPDIDSVVGDMTDVGAVQRATQGCDVVIHCAAKQFQPGTRSQFIAENAGGLESLARAALESGVGRFVHLSTINVHGYPPPHGCNADSPLRESGDFYSDSKIATERVAWQIYRECHLPLVVVRPACTYGPRGVAWTMTPVQRVRQGKRVLIGDGSGLCNTAYVDNLVDLILLAAKKDAAVGQAFIGSDGVGIPWREFYGAYARMLGIPRLNSVPLTFARAVAWASEVVARVTGTRPIIARQSVDFYSHHVVYDISKAQRILGYAPRVSFEEGMRQTAKWLEDSGHLK
ncbi:MAG: NAD-dependent epimerase/dehydratase family protein [Acidobacteriota bacterium]